MKKNKTQNNSYTFTFLPFLAFTHFYIFIYITLT